MVLLLAGAAVVVRHRHHRATAVGATGSSEPGDRWRGFEAGHEVPSRPGQRADLLPDPGTKEVTPEQVSAAMTAWREGILEKRQEQVVALDRAFSILPGRYGPELVKLAESDPDERVRAFSTRVLGKMRNAALVDDFQKMLADKSPFVRQNAAWALGELAARPGGREAAEAAFDDLRQVQGTDPVTEVRAAATNALKALQ